MRRFFEPFLGGGNTVRAAITGVRRRQGSCRESLVGPASLIFTVRWWLEPMTRTPDFGH
jgi:hypothetical protein